MAKPSSVCGGTLEFGFCEETQSLFASNGEKKLDLKDQDAFDFKDYQDATKTRAFPPLFQQLVNNAMQDNKTTKRYCCLEDLIETTGLLEPILLLIAEYFALDATMYSLKLLQCKLLPHQVSALEFALARIASLLALDMGLGKTITALATHLTTPSCYRTLIVCPAALKPNWKFEIKKFLGNNTVFVDLENTKKTETLLSTPNASIFLISYSLISIVLDHLMKIHWNLMICDEAHALKNWKSKRAKAMFKLRKERVQKLVLLTGTPASCSMSLWNLLRMIDPVMFKDFFHFKKAGVYYTHSDQVFYFAERYIVPNCVYAAGGRPQWAFTRSTHMEELHALTRQYILRQKKQDFLNLPPFIREHVVIGKSNAHQTKEFEEKMAKAQELAETKGQMYAQSLLMEQVRTVARIKLPLVLKYITQLLEGEDKFILWAHHKFVVEALHEHLDMLKVKHIVVNGDTSKVLRPKLYAQLENDPETRVGVLSLSACGTGLNLAFLQLAVYAELTFDQVALNQSEGRSHRIGQTGAQVVAQYLILEGSTDELIWKSMIRKTNHEGVMLDNKKGEFLFDTLTELQEDQDSSVYKYMEQQTNEDEVEESEYAEIEEGVRDEGAGGVKELSAGGVKELSAGGAKRKTTSIGKVSTKKQKTTLANRIVSDDDEEEEEEYV